MKRLVAGMWCVLALGPLAACGGTADASACGKALDSYHADLVASGDNLSNAQESAHQSAVVDKCDEATFTALLKGDSYDYTKGPGAIVIGNTSPHDAWVAFGGK